MDNLKATVGNNIKHLRESVHHLKQVELAKAVGTSEKTMISIEKGRAATNLDLLEKLAKELDVSPAQLTAPESLLRKLLGLWPKLDDIGKDALLVAAEDLFREQERRKKTPQNGSSAKGTR